MKEKFNRFANFMFAPFETTRSTIILIGIYALVITAWLAIVAASSVFSGKLLENPLAVVTILRFPYVFAGTFAVAHLITCNVIRKKKA